MEYVAFSSAYVILGIIFTVLAWDEETDESYGDLRPKGRYLFFARNIIFWPICFLYRLIFRRAKSDAEEE